MKNKILLFAALCASTFAVSAQETKKENPVTFYGFVRSEMFYDSYKGVNAASDMFYLFPSYVGLDKNGKDVNEQGSFNLGSMASRFGMKIAGPEIFKAKTSGVIEADFAGDLSGNLNLIRLLQANCVLTWAKTSLLVGQTWHPLWSLKAMPSVAGLNTGAPFQPFNRSPQIRVDHKISKFTLTGAIVTESQYRNVDATGKTDHLARNSAMPEFFAGIEANANGFTAGLGVSTKFIKPLLFLQDSVSPANKYNSDKLLNSATAMAYAGYTKGKFAIKAKTMAAQNSAYLTMPGGYVTYNKRLVSGVPSVDYTSYSTNSAFINVTYGAKWQAGIFAGALVNMGTLDEIKGKYDIYGLATSIQTMTRIAPSITLNVSKLRFTAEYEITSADFGVGAMNMKNGLFDNTHTATNHRGIITMMYMF